jgi:acyl-coenzyme A synthetase/AMP-(fatty) acid ligase
MIYHKLSNLFNDALADHPVAIRSGKEISFSQFRSDVASVANKYQNIRAALICEDSYNFLVGFFGLLHGGSSIISSSSVQASIKDIIEQECDVIISDAEIENIPPADFKLLPLDANRLSIDFFTSGSTGAPKRVTKNIRMFETEIQTLDSILPQKPGTVFATVPHYHVYGFVFKLLWPLASRHPFEVTTYGFWEGMLEQLTHDAFIVSSPTHLRRLAGVAKITDNIPAQILSAGAPLAVKNIEEIKNILGCIPTEIFGSTETGSIAMRCGMKENLPWQPLGSISIKKAEDGRMQLLSPHVSADWYTTDDLIDLAPGGFHFMGRADSVVKVEGRRVSLIKVEKALCDIPYVKEAVVKLFSGQTDYLTAIVVLSPEGQAQLEMLGNFRFSRLLRNELQPTLERISMPRHWHFVSNIPSHGIGKYKLEDLRQLVAG